MTPGTEEHPAVHLGVTATRHEITSMQRDAFIGVLLGVQPTHFHHGDCVGGDAETHDVVRQFCPDTIIVGHPPTNPKHRAFKECDVLWEERDYLVRNRDIVACVSRLVALPHTDAPIPRSGTWYTYGHAVKMGRSRVLITPDGHPVFIPGSS